MAELNDDGDAVVMNGFHEPAHSGLETIVIDAQHGRLGMPAIDFRRFHNDHADAVPGAIAVHVNQRLRRFAMNAGQVGMHRRADHPVGEPQRPHPDRLQ